MNCRPMADTVPSIVTSPAVPANAAKPLFHARDWFSVEVSQLVSAAFAVQVPSPPWMVPSGEVVVPFQYSISPLSTARFTWPGASWIS